MTNILTHQTGTGEPHASNHGLAAGELAIKQKATEHTTAASGKLYYGEDVSDIDSTSSTLRTFGIGTKADNGTTQSGVPLGGNLYFKDGSNMTITQATSGDVTTLTFVAASGSGLDISGNDNRLVKMHGSDDIQETGITIDDSNNITGVVALTATGLSTIGGALPKQMQVQYDSGNYVAYAIEDDGGTTITTAGDDDFLTFVSPTITLDAAGDITLDADGGNLYLKNGGTTYWEFDHGGNDLKLTAGGSNFEIENAGVFLIDSAGNFEVDSEGDIILDAAGDEIYLKDAGTERFKFNLDSTPELDVTGAFTIDCSAGITLDANAGSSDVTIIGDLSVGSIINSGTDITLDSAADIIIDAAGGNIEFKDAGTAQLTIDMDSTAGDIDVNLMVNGDDLVFNQFDGTEVLRIKDNGKVTTGSHLDVGGSLISDTHSNSSGNLTIAPANDVVVGSGTWGYDFTITNGADGAAWAFIAANSSTKYLNFCDVSSPVTNSSGYGFRDNNGTMQVKNSGGAWSDFGVAGGEANVDAYGHVAVAGQTTCDADQDGDTLTLVAGSNMTITTSADSITLAASGGSGDITAVVAGALLDGGASSGSATLDVDLSELTDGTSDIDSNDEVVYLDNGSQKRKAFSELKLGQFNNDQGWVTSAGVTSAVAGSGIDVSGATGAVTISIGTGEVVNAMIGNDEIDSEHYAGGSIDHIHLANDCIDGDNIQNDVINSEHYAAASIDNEHLADNAVDTAEIADNAVTLAKMASGTDGNIISFDASGNPVAISTGSDGQVLTSAGAGQPPAFEDASGGGGGGVITATANGSDNRIATYSAATALNGEASLTFDGTTLTNSAGPIVDSAGQVMSSFAMDQGAALHGLANSSFGSGLFALAFAAGPSDERLKTGITTLEYGLDEIKAISPKWYKYNESSFNSSGLALPIPTNHEHKDAYYNEQHSGLMAADVKAVMPKLVSLMEDDKDYETYDKDALIFVLVNAVKELEARVATLEG